MKKARIEEIEPQFAQKLDAPWKDILQELSFPVPDNGYRLRVSLHNAKRRKKPSNAAAENWSPTSSDRAEIWFERAPQQQKVPIHASPRGIEGPSDRRSQEASEDARTQSTCVQPPEAGLLKALDRAESKPGWSFVSLKKFRDEILPAEPSAPGASQPTDVHWQNLLRSAIDKRFILVGKVQNPKSPQFPVTTIRLNRLMPEVKAVLGGGGAGDLEFRPVEIKGEPLSATVMRERHR